MRLFVDSALPSDWEYFKSLGLLYGATTNPLIFQKQEVNPSMETLLELVDIAEDMGLAELQLQVTGLDDPEAASERMMALFEAWPEGVVAKVPMTLPGLAAMRLLEDEVPITLTAGYEAKQAILASTMGLRYIAPYFGRLNEAGQDGTKIVGDMLSICQKAEQPTPPRVLVASLRSAEQVADLAALGHDTFTIAPAVFHELLSSDLSDQATQAFEAAAAG